MSEMKQANIKKELDEILSIVFEAQESNKILNFLSTSSDDDEVDYQKHMNGFLSYCRTVYYKDTVISLSKLFHESKNEHFNLPKFINKLESDKNYNGVIPAKTLNDWRYHIAAANDIITNVKENRAQFAAHKDRNFKPEDYPLKLKDLKELVGIAQKIAKDIYVILGKGSFMIDDPIGSPVDNLKYIVNVLANKKKDSLRPYLKEAETYGLEDEIPEWFRKEQ